MNDTIHDNLSDGAMPHITVEYSSNLDGIVDMGEFCQVLNRSAATTGLFPLAGIRARAVRCEQFAIADLDPDNGFIDISVRLRGGRTLAARQQATAEIFSEAETYLQSVLATRPIALSMEMRDIDPRLSPKTSSIRRFLDTRERS